MSGHRKDMIKYARQPETELGAVAIPNIERLSIRQLEAIIDAYHCIQEYGPKPRKAS